MSAALWRIEIQATWGDGGGCVVLFALTDDATVLPDAEESLRVVDREKRMAMFQIDSVLLLTASSPLAPASERVHDQRDARQLPMAQAKLLAGIEGASPC
jgi:hypothetical protein